MATPQWCVPLSHAVASPRRSTATLSDYFGMQPQVLPCVVNGVSFIFYLLDSNELLTGGLNAWNIRNALGRGRVGKAQISNVLAMHNQLLAGNVPVPAGFDLATAVRIGVLHHHPAIPEGHPGGN